MGKETGARSQIFCLVKVEVSMIVDIIYKRLSKEDGKDWKEKGRDVKTEVSSLSLHNNYWIHWKSDS